MSANMNLKQQVRDGRLSVAQAKRMLREKAGADTEKTHTWRWLCRLETAGLLTGRAV